jgi:hypothetical protein
MLRGETITNAMTGLVTPIKVFWNHNHFEAICNGEPHDVPKNFSGFHIVKKRPMSRYEILAWATSEESRGWFVNIHLKCDNELQGDWQFPTHFKYDNYEDTADDIYIYEYVRAKLRTDLSGIDENTIQGFEIEEE